jgi:hypothetical protein
MYIIFGHQGVFQKEKLWDVDIERSNAKLSNSGTTLVARNLG